MAPTNIQQSSSVVAKITKYFALTWDQATFTWNQSGDSTWNNQFPAVINTVQSSSVITKVTKSPAP